MGLSESVVIHLKWKKIGFMSGNYGITSYVKKFRNFGENRVII